MDGAVLIGVDPLDEAAGTELVRRWHADADEETAADAVRLCARHPLTLRTGGWSVQVAFTPSTSVL
ncbi:hypothetical protein [Streptomyces sp. NPDC059258]|uniref:hypothetical protein n=1 Tax=unclassified Streptomyces TaxID=2593676 RepID=UPI003682C4F6